MTGSCKGPVRRTENQSFEAFDIDTIDDDINNNNNNNNNTDNNNNNNNNNSSNNQ